MRSCTCSDAPLPPIPRECSFPTCLSFSRDIFHLILILPNVQTLNAPPSPAAIAGMLSLRRSASKNSSRARLEQDVKKLQQLLKEETNLHIVLENALQHAVLTLSDMSYLPVNAQELLANISTLEAAITRLEDKMSFLNIQLTQERNERRLVEYQVKKLTSQSLSFVSRQSGDWERKDINVDMNVPKETTCSEEKLNDVAVKLPKPLMGKFSCFPNRLSEEIVRCMKNIFVSLADSSHETSKSFSSDYLQLIPSPSGNYAISSFWSISEPSSISSWVQSPRVDLHCNNSLLASGTVFDPYSAREKLSWADIGNYGSAKEVSWMSVGKKQLEHAADALRRFRLLIEQLTEVNPVQLSEDERLAFWINIYNALMMHAYLAYGVPRSEMKLLSLMQKAAYTIGGQLFNAALIEYVVLKMKQPNHRPQMALLLALNKLKVPEELKKFSIKTTEPLLAFALSCGMHSSPAVKVYTAPNVREELQDAQRDYMRASVGVSRKGKLFIPKLVHCFARGIMDDTSIPVWITHFLPQQQAAFVEQCMSQRRQSILGSRSFSVIPFDSRFRYLFMPDTLS